MNKKGFELAISTMILLVVGILLLIGLAYFITDGFSKFRTSTKSFTESNDGSAVKQACEIACDTENKLFYCCNEFNVSDETLKCDDSRLEVSCGLDCEGFSCESQ